MATQNPTPKASKEAQAVIDALGSSGEKVVAFVNKTVSDIMLANANTLKKATERFNLYVESAEAKERGNTVLLTSIRDAINTALGKHSAVAMALNDGQEVTPADVSEAVAATAAVDKLEIKWKAKVDETLEDHETRIVALEGRNTVPVLALVPTPELEPTKGGTEVLAAMLDEPQHNRNTYVQLINPKTWGLVAWVAAFLGLIVTGLIVLQGGEGFFPGRTGFFGFVRLAVLAGFLLFGFFTGGTIGSYFDSKRQSAKSTMSPATA